MDKQTLKHIAELSRISLTDEELEKGFQTLPNITL